MWDIILIRKYYLKEVVSFMDISTEVIINKNIIIIIIIIITISVLKKNKIFKDFVMWPRWQSFRK
jgi:hypothetical protein